MLLNDNFCSPEPTCLIPNQLIFLSKGPLAEWRSHSSTFNTAWAGRRSSSITLHRVRGFLPPQFSSTVPSHSPFQAQRDIIYFSSFSMWVWDPFPVSQRSLHRTVRQYSRAALHIYIHCWSCVEVSKDFRQDPVTRNQKNFKNWYVLKPGFEHATYWTLAGKHMCDHVWQTFYTCKTVNKTFQKLFWLGFSQQAESQTWSNVHNFYCIHVSGVFLV